MTLARRLILAAASIRNRHILDEDDVMLARTVTLSTADILALDSTPFELVPAPGAGKVAVPALIAMSNTVSAGPVENNSAALSVNLGEVGIECYNNPDAGIVRSSTPRFGVVLPTANQNEAVDDVENQPITLTASEAFTDPGDADTTLTVTTHYVIVDLPS